jgi:MFS family permease
MAAKQAAAASVSTRAIFGMPAFWALVAMFTPMYFVATGFQYTIQPLAGDAGIGAETTAGIVSAMATAMIVGKVGFGWLMDRASHRWVFAAAALGMCGTVLLLNVVPAASLPTTIVAVGLFNGSILPMKGALVAAWFGASHYGRAVGLMSPLLMTSSAAPLVIAGLRESSRGYALPFSLLAIAVLPGVFVALWFAARRTSALA